MSLTKPRPISGFPEWLPEQKLAEDRMIQTIREEFERFGFSPLETPAVERTEVLTAKGVVDKEIYALSRLNPRDGQDPQTDLSLHFDLTVPTARYVAQHFSHLVFPFRRYQIQKVWRGERPQAGRFREFYQCDIDIIGNEKLGLISDAEIPCVIHSVFARLEREMSMGPFIIRLNNRKVLQGLMETHGLDGDASATALRCIDALEKVGKDRVKADLTSEAGLAEPTAQRLLDFLDIEPTIEALSSYEGNATYQEGVKELKTVTEYLDAFGVPKEAYRIDVSIARGLDYYTGTIYETQLLDAPDLGSICSGGRYDNLASNYTKQHLPGVGISIGLSRLISRLFDAKVLTPTRKTPAAVLVTTMDPSRIPAYLSMAADLRREGIATEVYTEDKKFKAQMKYADAKGFDLAVIAGENELAQGKVQVKDLRAATQTEVDRANLVREVRAMLAKTSD